MGHVTIDPGLIKTSSDYFEVRSTGLSETGTLSSVVAAVVRRKGGSGIQIVSWGAE